MNINIVDVKFDNDVNFSELNLKINNVLVNKIKFMNNSDFSKSKFIKLIYQNNYSIQINQTLY